MFFSLNLDYLFQSIRKTVACCKHVLKDFWQSLRIDPTEKCEIWIEEAKQKRFRSFLHFILIIKERIV